MKILALFLIVLCFQTAVFTQQVESQQSQSLNEPLKIDDFNEEIHNECDRGARMDILIAYLLNNPSTKGEIIIYLGANDPLSLQTPGRFQIYKRRLQIYAKLKDFDESRLDFTYGEFRPKVTTELWIYANNGKKPQPSNTLPKPEIPKDKVSLFSKTLLTPPYGDLEPDELLLPKLKEELDEANKEWKEEFKKSDTQETILSKEEDEEIKYFWAEKEFGDIIKNLPGSKGIVIYYFDNQRLDSKKVKNFIEKGKQRIAKESGVSPNSIKVVFGGYKEYFQGEMWIVPQNTTKPTPKPEQKA